MVCGSPYSDILHLARHVKGSHGKAAMEAYRKGYWERMSDEPNMFSDSAAPLIELAPAALATPVKETVAELVRQEKIEAAGPPVYIEPKADLIYGASGSGKTYNISNVSDYVLEKYGKLTRIVSADGGGLGPAKGKADAGQIAFWGIAAWKNPMEAMWKAVRGHWPLRLDDPESPLVPPDAGTWEVYGYIAFESLTSWGDKILDNLKAKKASLSQDPSYTYREGDVEFSGGNQSYYGLMQDQLQSFVFSSHLLGIEIVNWTAHESKGDDTSGLKVYGPMIGGKKATGKAAGWFRNTWHMEVVQGEQFKDKESGQLIQDVRYLLFIKTHIDPSTMIPFPCKFRAPVSKPFIESDKGMQAAMAYKMLDDYNKIEAADAEKRIDKISGLRDKLLENAAKARKAEAEAAEKRAKATGLLKPMVRVPAMPLGPMPPPMVPHVAKPPAPVAPAIPAAKPKPITIQQVVKPLPTIQNVRKPK